MWILGWWGCSPIWERDLPVVYAPAEIPIACGVAPTPLRTLYVDPGGDDAFDGTCRDLSDGCGPVRTVARAFDLARGGDHVVLSAGRFPGPTPVATLIGEANAPIVIRGEPNTIIEDTWVLEDSSHVEIRGLTLHSQRGPWIEVRGASHHVRLIGLGLDQPEVRYVSFWGLLLEGEDHTVCGSTFGVWIGDMITALGDRLAFIHNDLSDTRADHAVLSWTGQGAWCTATCSTTPGIG